MIGNQTIISFLKAIDAELARHANPGDRLEFYVLGRSSLILLHQADMMTKDVDVIYIHDLVLLTKRKDSLEKARPTPANGASIWKPSRPVSLRYRADTKPAP